MTKLMTLALALFALFSLVPEASAARRCGDFIYNGTIYVASNARDCDRAFGWQQGPHGRYWGPRNYQPKAKREVAIITQRAFVPTAAAQRLRISASAPISIGKQTGAQNNCPVGKKVGEPYQCPTSSTGWCICK